MTSRLVSAALFLISALASHAELHRGVWFWGSTTLPDASPSPYGSSIVVGDGTAEDETIDFFTEHAVRRVYGSYQNRPVSEESTIAAWNAKLDAAGISSQILIDGIAVNDPATITSIKNKITNRLINFNIAQGADEASKFDALHLDLEPQGLGVWDGGTPTVKRALLDDLYDAYVEIRNHLDAAGAPFDTMPIYADLPFFFDKLPVDGGSVGWTNAADRDGWYTDCANELDGISLMTFSKDNFTSYDAAVDYERTSAFLGKARAGIQPKVGPSELWLNIAEFREVMDDLEDAYGPTGAVDIENYGFWRHAIETTEEALHRGVWFWGSTTLPDASPSPYGSIDVVGVAAAETETIAFFTAHGIKRVYGSYQNRPVSEASTIANWNSQLDAAGISSQLLIDGIAVNDPAEVTNIIGKITNRLINFNNALGVDTPSKFDALHLDLEPQGLTAWDVGTPADKRDLLDDLYDAYADIRAHLDTNGFEDMHIYADIPFFWDKLPVDGGSVGWADAADRDGWYTSIATVLNGISIMTFSKDNFASYDAAVDYERHTCFLGNARAGIQPKVGPSELWLTIFQYNVVMNDLEDAYGPTGATDIENYGFWRHALATTGVTVGEPIEATLGSVSGGPIYWGDGSGGGDDDDDPVIIFPGIPGYLYTVREGNNPGNLDHFSTIARTRSVDQEILRVPLNPNGVDQWFWRIERIPVGP